MKYVKFKTDALMRNLRQMVNDGIITPLQTPAWRDTLKQWDVMDRWDKADRPFVRYSRHFLEEVRKVDFTKFDWKPDLPIDPIAVEWPESMKYYMKSISKKGIPLDSDEYCHELTRLRAALLFKDEETVSAITYSTTSDGKGANGYFRDVFQFDDQKHIHLLGAIAISMAAMKTMPTGHYGKEGD